MKSFGHNNKISHRSFMFLFFNLLLLLCAQIFCGILSVSSFEKVYVDSLTGIYLIPARTVRRSIENGLRLGKRLERFYGLERLLKAVKVKARDISGAIVVDSEGKVISQIVNPGVGIPPLDFSLTSKNGSDEVFVRKKYQDYFWIFVPLHYRSEKVVGMAGVSFPASIVHKKLKYLIRIQLILLGIVFGTGALLFSIIYLLTKKPFDVEPSSGQIPKRHLIHTLLLFMIVQCVYAGFSMWQFKKLYMEISRDKALRLGRDVQLDVENLLNKGLSLKKMKNMDKWIGYLLEAAPEVDHIAVTDASLNLLYIAGDTEHFKGLEKVPVSSEFEIRLPLTGQNQLRGLLIIHLSRDRLRKVLWSLILDIITIIGISFLFVFELLVFYRVVLFKKFIGVSDLPAKLSFWLRPLAFIFMFAMDLPLSFIPLQMKELYQPLWGLPKELVLGLPISAEMSMAGIAVLTSGILIDRIGWRSPCLLGFAIVALGNILSGRSITPLEFVSARAVVGIGYGLSWMSFQGYVFTHLPQDKQGRGIAQITAGVLAGSLCGAAVGGILAERVGFAPVFYASTLCITMAIITLAVFYPDTYFKEVSQKAGENNKKEVGSLWAFFKDPSILGLGLFFSFPTALCTVGFLYYAIPLYLNALKVSQSTIGRTLMLYGVCLIYFGPLLGRYVDKSKDKGPFLMLSGLIGGGALALFYWWHGLLVAVISVFLFGLATSIGYSAEAAYAISLPVVRKIGVNRSMALLRTLQRSGQVIGPIMVGTLSAVTGGNTALGIVVIGWGYLFLILLFTLSWIIKPVK